MSNAFLLAIAVLIGEIIGYRVGKLAAEPRLDQDHLLELKKHKADLEWKYISEFDGEE